MITPFQRGFYAVIGNSTTASPRLMVCLSAPSENNLGAWGRPVWASAFFPQENYRHTSFATLFFGTEKYVGATVSSVLHGRAFGPIPGAGFISRLDIKVEGLTGTANYWLSNGTTPLCHYRNQPLLVLRIIP